MAQVATEELGHSGQGNGDQDSQGALNLLKNPIASVRTKHIDVMHHFARERVAFKEVRFEYCSTEFMVADCLTKPVPISKLQFCCSGMGVV